MKDFANLVFRFVFFIFVAGIITAHAPRIIRDWAKREFALRIEKLEQENHRLLSQVNDCETKEKENHFLREQLAQSEESSRRKDTQITHLKNENEAVTAQLSNTILALNEAREESAKQQDRITSLENDLETSKEQNTALQSIILNLEDKIALLTPLAKETENARREADIYKHVMAAMGVIIIILVAMIFNNWPRRKTVVRNIIRQKPDFSLSQTG